MMLYLACSIIICIPLTYLTKSSLDVIDENVPDPEALRESKDTAHLILCTLLSIYLLISIYSCIFASRRLDRKGINKVIR